MALAASEQRGNQSCLWVFFHYATLGIKERDLKMFDGRIIWVVGVVDPARKGHMRAFPGAVTIRRLTLE